MKRKWWSSFCLFSLISTIPLQAIPNESLIKEIWQKTACTHSDVVLVEKAHESLVYLTTSKDLQQLDLLSITPIFFNLAVGFLVDEQKLSLEQPVSDFYPEWRQGKKKEITIAQLMNQTSGLVDSGDINEMYAAPNVIQFALAANQNSKPGTSFNYSNNSINLLAGIIHKASGMHADEYLYEKLFAPLNITDYSWHTDEAGNPLGMAGVKMRADDLIKVGRLIADEGKWDDKQLLSKEWITTSMATTPLSANKDYPPKFGLLWWVLEQAPKAYFAMGSGGQYLVIIPEKKIVAVRQAKYPENGVWKETDEFADFIRLARSLAVAQ